jgi:hypothetical protein
MARPRKTPERRQNRATRDLEPVASVVAADFGPKPSSTWLKATVDQWVDLWASDLATQILDTDRPALVRLFDWRDEQARCRRRAKAARDGADESPLVDGSKGQPVANPLYEIAKWNDDEALAIETRIVALEDRLALSPKARLTLGVTQQKGQSLAMQNAQIASAIAEVMRDSPDPRTVGRKPATGTG